MGGMPLDHVADAITLAADALDAADTADSVHRKWGCKGCLIALLLLAVVILPIPCGSGAFSGA
ncbi:hypothetical protein DM450_00055 [Sphingomonas sp. IC081]|nr:hypothetical protein DM450_00055 [Sphingomonas sp. IC081]